MCWNFILAHIIVQYRNQFEGMMSAMLLSLNHFYQAMILKNAILNTHQTIKISEAFILKSQNLFKDYDAEIIGFKHMIKPFY